MGYTTTNIEEAEMSNQTIEQLIENTPYEDFQFVLPFKLTEKQMSNSFGHQVQIANDRQTIQIDTDILLEVRGDELVEGKSPSWITFEQFIDELEWDIDRFSYPHNWDDVQACGKADCECATEDGLYAIYDREQEEAGCWKSYTKREGHYRISRETKHTIGYQAKLKTNSWKRLLTKVYKLGEVQ